MSDTAKTWHDIPVVSKDPDRLAFGTLVRTLGMDGRLRYAKVKECRTYMGKPGLYYTFLDFLEERHEAAIWPVDLDDAEEVEAWLATEI